MAQTQKPAVKPAQATVKPIETVKPVETSKPIEPTSEELTKLNGNLAELNAKLPKAEAGSDEQFEIISNIIKAREAIKAEKAAIAKHESELLINEKRAAQTKILDEDFVNAYEANKANPEDEIAKDNFAKAREVILKYLHGGVAKTATAKNATGSTATGARGATTAAIRELIAPMYVGATSDNVAEIGKAAREASIKDNGFNDGTANAVILAYEKELGLK